MMSVLIKLRDNKNLTEAESQVRDYILKTPNEIIDLTSKELGERTYTSAATVVRLCKRIGIGGFNKLKLSINQELKVFESKNIEILDSTYISPDDNVKEIVDKLNTINIQSIEETSILINTETLKKVVELIKEAKILDLYGIGNSHIIALDATFKFTRVGKNAINFALYDRQYVQALNSNQEHFALLFSYSGESKQILDIAQILKDNFVKTVSITSSSENTLSKLCDYNLYVSNKESKFRSGAISSRTASLHVVDILYTVYCNYDYKNSSHKIHKTRIEG